MSSGPKSSGVCVSGRGVPGVLTGRGLSLPPTVGKSETPSWGTLAALLAVEWAQQVSSEFQSYPLTALQRWGSPPQQPRAHPVSPLTVGPHLEAPAVYCWNYTLTVVERKQYALGSEVSVKPTGLVWSMGPPLCRHVCSCP